MPTSGACDARRPTPHAHIRLGQASQATWEVTVCTWKDPNVDPEPGWLRPQQRPCRPGYDHDFIPFTMGLSLSLSIIVHTPSSMSMRSQSGRRLRIWGPIIMTMYRISRRIRLANVHRAKSDHLFFLEWGGARGAESTVLVLEQ